MSNQKWLAVFLVLVGCQTSLSVPDGSVIECTSDDACPPDFRCQLTLELCVPQGVEDDQAPGVEMVTVSPTVGRSGQEFTVTFNANELLGINPIVELAIGIPEDYPALVFEGRDGTTYTYSYISSGGEPEGDVTILARLVDAFGNEASGINLGTMTFDFTSPEFVAPPTVSPLSLGGSTLLSADFTLNETSFAPPEVELVNLADSTQRVLLQIDAGSSADPTWSYTLDLASVTTPLDDGGYAVQVRAEDLAGNVTSPRLIAGEVALDRTPPVVEEELGLTYVPDAGNPLGAIGSLRNDATARIAFRASEPLGQLPAVTSSCSGDVVQWASVGGAVGGTFFDYSLMLSSADVAPDGACSISVDLVDEAGNAMMGIPLSSMLVVDRSAPSAPMAVDTTQLKHLRVPWGADQVTQPGQFIVEFGLTSSEDPSTSTIGPGIFNQPGEDLRRVEVYVSGTGGLPISIIEPVDVSIVPASREWSVPPIPGDFGELWLGVLDSSGNRSLDRVRVDQGEWVATLGSKVVGSDVSNPHRFAIAGQFSAAPRQSVAVEADAASGIDARGAGILNTAGGASWRALALPPNPQRRGQAATAYDGLRGRWVVFGGISDGNCDGGVGTTCTGLWEWDGANWAQVVPTDPEGDGNPIPRTRGTMVYDSVRQRVVLFGGRWGNATPANDIWEWDGLSWEQRCDGSPASDVCPAAPVARSGHAASFDWRRGRMVVFGGVDVNSVNLSDTWEWDGASWNQVCETAGQPGECATQPASRSVAAMVYDEAREVSILYGGLGGSLYSDHWEWDGTTWTERCDGSPAGDTCPKPGIRLVHTITYDAARQRTVLFGGQADFGGSDIRDELWEWDGTAWEERCDGSPAMDTCSSQPLARRNPSIGYDRARERVVLFGGNVSFMDDCGGSTTCDDTWTWDGADWLQEGPHDPEGDGNPGSRWALDMAYDPANMEVVLFGGTEPNSNYADYGDTWVYNGRSWEEQCTGCSAGTTTPDLLARHSMTYSSDLGGVVVFGGEPGPVSPCSAGGYADSLWLWGGATWSEACDGGGGCGDEPGLRTGVALASDDLGQMLFIGGEIPMGAPSPCDVVSQPILWRLGSYGDVSSGGDPPGRQQAAMTFDESRGVWVLYGGWDGAALEQSIWEWNGTAWSNVTPSSNPPWRRAAKLTYHAALGKSVLTFGRSTECGALENCDDVWTWDGTSWTQLTIADVEGDGSPFPRAYHGAIYDNDRDRLLVFGGGQRIFNGISSATFVAGDDLWELVPGDTSRPGHAFSANIDAVGLPSFSSIDGVAVLWSAAASGGGATADGAALSLWSGGQWIELVTNGEQATASPSAAWDLSWDSSTDSELSGLNADTLWRRFVSGTDRSEILTAVAPVGSNSTERAVLETDYVEIRVRYSL